MGFGCRCYLGVLVVVGLWGNIAAGREGGRSSEITVLIYNSAGISVPVLSRAEVEAARIFRAAGIDIVWVDCSNGAAMVDEACHGVSGSNYFVLHIVSKGRTSSELVFGLAFLAQDGAGKYSDVFFDRVEQAHGQFGANVSQLLGTVASHELGHLLLGSHAHAYNGIMAPVWREEILRHMDMGTLLFTPDQASLMKRRIRDSEMSLASTGAGGGK
jgi:hypothetical protein